MNKVVAVVVTYNRRELLKLCISHLKEQSVGCDILIVDNASTDGTDEEFADNSSGVLYFNTGSNLGGAGGFSFGIKKAVELGYEYLWILDDDTMPTETTLECFMKKAAQLKGNFGYLSSKVLWKDDTICSMNVQKKTKWNRLTDFECTQMIQYASFVSLFIESATVKQVGLPYKEFFIWADDWEYTRRISKRYSCYYVPESIVNHWCATNVGADIVSTETSRMGRFNYMYRNDVVMYRQDGAEGMIYLLLRNMTHIMRILVKSTDKWRKIKLLCKATATGFGFRPVVDFPEGN